MIHVTKTYLPPLDQYLRQIEKIWQVGQITNNGPLSRQLNDDLRKYLGVSNLELVANGTLALQIAIKALDLKGKIITTPYSYVATTNAILWEGCEPVFVDIDDQSFCINPDLIEAAITEETAAILATHVYGYPCDVLKIQEIADKYGLKVIYDAAHAFGVKLFGKSILLHGDCSILSFHATKLFHTIEGGAIVCQDMQVSHRVFLMKKFGHIGEDEYHDVGINAKISEPHAAMGLCVLPKLNDIIEARRLVISWYDEYFKGYPLQRPAAMDGLEYNYAYYPVVFETYKQMMQVKTILIAHDIVPRRYFYPSLNTLPYLKPELQRPCPVAESIAGRVLCLPLYFSLKQEDVDRICEIVIGVIK